MSESHQSRLLLRSSILIAVSRAIALLTLLACTPVVIHYLGTEGYALWEVLVSYYAAISIIQISAGSVALWQFAKCYGLDTKELLKSFRSISGMFLIASSIIILVFIAFSPLLTNQLDSKTPLISNATYVIPWMASLGLLATYNRIMLSLVTASNRSGTAVAMQSFGTVTACVASLTYLFFEQSIYAMPFGLMAGMLVTFSICYYYIRRHLNLKLPLPNLPDKKHLATYSIYAVTTTLASLTVLARDQTDRLLTASYSAINEVAHMAVSQRVTNSLMELSMVILIPMSAVVGNLHANNNHEGCYRVYRRYCSLTTIAVGTASIVIWILHPYLFTLWLGTSQVESTPYLFWGLLGTLIAVSTSAPAAVLSKATGLPRLELYAGITTLTLLILFKPFALQCYGPIGLCACSAICWAIGSLTLMLLAKRHFPDATHHLWNDLKTTAYTAVLLILCYFLLPNLPPAGRLSSASMLVIASPLIAIIYLAILYSMNALDPSIQRAVVRRLDLANRRLLNS